MEGVRKSLQITLENCEFAKEFHYFLTVQLDGEGEKVPNPHTLNFSASHRCVSSSHQPSVLSEHLLPTHPAAQIRPEPTSPIRLLCRN